MSEKNLERTLSFPGAIHSNLVFTERVTVLSFSKTFSEFILNQMPIFGWYFKNTMRKYTQPVL